MSKDNLRRIAQPCSSKKSELAFSFAKSLCNAFRIEIGAERSSGFPMTRFTVSIAKEIGLRAGALSI